MLNIFYLFVTQNQLLLFFVGKGFDVSIEIHGVWTKVYEEKILSLHPSFHLLSFLTNSHPILNIK